MDSFIGILQETLIWTADVNRIIEKNPIGIPNEKADDFTYFLFLDSVSRAEGLVVSSIVNEF